MIAVGYVEDVLTIYMPIFSKTMDVLMLLVEPHLPDIKSIEHVWDTMGDFAPSSIDFGTVDAIDSEKCSF